VTVALTNAPTVIVLKTNAMGPGIPVVQTVTVALTTVTMVIVATNAMDPGIPVVQTVTVAPTTVPTALASKSRPSVYSSIEEKSQESYRSSELYTSS
jgi:hypothetical protein